MGLGGARDHELLEHTLHGSHHPCLLLTIPDHDVWDVVTGMSTRAICCFRADAEMVPDLVCKRGRCAEVHPSRVPGEGLNLVHEDIVAAKTTQTRVAVAIAI